jgi:PPM family protein phosphatase
VTSDRASRSVLGGAERLEIAGISDIGPVRTQNQDVWAAEASGDGAGAVLALADGMGGHKGGLECADAAITGAMSVLSQVRADDDPAATLRRAVVAASESVAGVRDQIGGNPGTTLVLALVRGLHATVVNVGDSRGYLMHGAAVTQITEDHSWAAAQVRAGAMSAEEARHHQKRNLIERAVMGDPVEADVFEIDAAPGDVLLLCSDGLWEPLADSALGAVLASPDALGMALTRACDAALAGGGTDNVTMVANRWLPVPSATV